MKTGLISCGKEKLSSAAPAQDMYQGDLFKKAWAYAEATYDQCYILSAKYGLLEPNQIIESYDLTLKDMDRKARREWADKIYEQIKKRCVLDNVFYIHAGKLYREYLELYLGLVQVPLEGLGIGQQKAWYKAKGF